MPEFSRSPATSSSPDAARKPAPAQPSASPRDALRVGARGLGYSDGAATLAPRQPGAPDEEGGWEAVTSGRQALRRGSSGPLVKALQQALIKAGQDVTTDGEFGPGTEAAVKAVQAGANLAADGVVGPATAQAIDAQAAWQLVVLGGRTLDLGSEGPAVRRLQQLLTSAGFGVGLTGLYGPTTQGQVVSFQKSKGVEATGKVGPTTAKALNEAAAGGNLGPATRVEAYEDGESQGPIECVEIEGSLVERRTAAAYLKMRDAAARDGHRLRLNSGFRSNEEQAQLYRRYLAGTGNLAAPPGYSNHQNGIALDIDAMDDAVFEWLTAHAGTFGFVRTVPSEEWHWEYRP